MIQKSETPLASGTANGANFKMVEASASDYPRASGLATLSQIRSEHIVRKLGVSSEAAATITAIHFARAL